MAMARNQLAVLGLALAGTMVLAGCGRNDEAQASKTSGAPAAKVSTPGASASSAQVNPNPSAAGQPSSGSRNPAAAANRPPAKPAPVLGAPPIEFQPPVLDLGVIRPNERISAKIMVVNIGDKALKILSSKADCTCTSVDLSNTIIGPGESVPLGISYNTASTGDRHAAVRVLIEGYDVTEVAIKAYVTMPIEAVPAFIVALPDANGTVPLTGEYTIGSRDQRPFRVLAVNGGAVPYADDFNPDNDSPRNSYKLKWDLTGFDKQTCTDANGNRLPGWVLVETDHPDCPIIDLEIRNECNRRAKPQPTDTWMIQDKRVQIGGVQEGVPYEFEVVAKWMGRRPQGGEKITSATSESPQFTAEFVGASPVDDGFVYKFRVTPAKGHHGLIYGTMRVQSKTQSAPMLIFGTVR